MFKLINKSSIKALLIATIVLASLLIFSLNSLASAKSYTNPSYEIDYFINEDSTVEVEERIEFNFDGTFYEVSRWITLLDKQSYERCQNNPNLQCGGFDFIYIQDVYGEEGEVLDEDDYSITVGEQNLGYGYENVVNVKYEFAPNGRNFSSESFTWGLDYKAYGSLGFFDDYTFFYWDTAANREKDIEQFTATIHFPESIELNPPEDLVVYGYTDYFYEHQGDKLIIESDGPVRSGDDYTIALKLPRDLVTEPGSIRLKPNNDFFELFSPSYQLEIDGRTIQGQTNEFKGLPAGESEYTFKSDLFEEFETEVDVVSGDQTVVEVSPSPKFFVQILIYLAICCNLVGLVLIFLAIIFPILKWYRKGRDEGGRGTIVPWFKPPEGMVPAMLGSLKDEKPDIVDITATIINAAYNGYVKIEELDKKGKKFKFHKLKDFDDLDPIEQKILKSIFGSKKTTTTSKLKNSFYIKLPGIKSKIYKEMVAKGYFKERPDQVRNKNRALGIVILIMSIGLIIAVSSFTSGIGLIFTILPFSAAGLFGILTIIISNFMPAKTSLGTKNLERILGFKMYLETAEKYTLQDLTPDLFEKYLPYAIVFGIEKKWAKKFEDIYTGQPDWYDGQSTDWTPYILVRSLSNLNTTTSGAMTSKLSSSSSSSGWSGGGWSGGGGFSGGFSGGGAGGGGFGAR